MNERQKSITLEQVRCKIADADIRIESALNRAMRNQPDYEYQLSLAFKAVQDKEIWQKVLSSLERL
jgi:hypothetical protein